LPGAVLPIQCHAEDDFGLTSLLAALSYSTGDTSDLAEFRLPLLPSSQLGRAGEPTDQREANVNQSLELEPLKLAAGSNLHLQIEAADNNDMTGPSAGRSAEFRSDLLRREKAERRELERLLKSQDELLTDCRALSATAPVAGSPISTQLEQLQTIYRGQKQIGPKLATIANRIAALAAEIETNRLPDPGKTLQSRLRSRIAKPLTELTAKQLPTVVEALDATRQTAPTDQKIDLASAIAGQVEIASEIKRILHQMLSSEGYQEAVDLLYEIQKTQTDVYEQTNKAREEQIKRILEGRE
jgi:hypothetical protein